MLADLWSVDSMRAIDRKSPSSPLIEAAQHRAEGLAGFHESGNNDRGNIGFLERRIHINTFESPAVHFDGFPFLKNSIGVLPHFCSRQCKRQMLLLFLHRLSRLRFG